MTNIIEFVKKDETKESCLERIKQLHQEYNKLFIKMLHTEYINDNGDIDFKEDIQKIGKQLMKKHSELEKAQDEFWKMT